MPSRKQRIAKQRYNRVKKADKRSAGRRDNTCDITFDRRLFSFRAGYQKRAEGSYKKAEWRKKDVEREGEREKEERGRKMEGQKDRERSHFAVWNLIGGIPVMDARLSSGSRTTKRSPRKDRGRTSSNEGTICS